ncbi:MAG: autotransporter domain-containing protein [Desulfobulbaceae bacterium]|nr:autotransporter domain-containing protein [Desulfobulbaceae bacterium]
MVTAYKLYSMTASAAGGNETCDEILEEEGLSPNDVVWQAQNPSGEIVDIKAEEACKVCVVGNGKPEWKCTPYDPSNPIDPIDPIPITPEVPTVPGNCDGLSGALSGDCKDPTPITPEVPVAPGPTDPIPITPEVPVTPGPTDPTPITPEVPVAPGPTDPEPVTPPVIVEVAEEVDSNTALQFPNLNRERAIEIIRTIFLPRNVDAQPRAFSSYGVSLRRAANNAECPSSDKKYNVWGSLLHSRDGEGDESDLIWNAFDSESTGIATGACFPHGEKNRWGLMFHYGKTDIEHDLPGKYESDNYGAGVFYIFQNQYTRINSSVIYSYHDGENHRDFSNMINSYGDRDSSALHFGVAIEGLDAEKDDQEIVPFANLLFSYIDQDAYEEEGFPWFTLDFDRRQSWWLNAEAGVKWIKHFLTVGENTWGWETGVALTFLDNIADEDQRFTYYWNRTLGISSKGDEEFGGALRFGLFWKPKDPNAWRVSASLDVGYLSEQVNHSTILTFVLPFGE